MCTLATKVYMLVILADAGIHGQRKHSQSLDSRLRGNDGTYVLNDGAYVLNGRS